MNTMIIAGAIALAIVAGRSFIRAVIEDENARQEKEYWEEFTRHNNIRAGARDRRRKV